MDNERLLRRLIGTFVAELDDHLRALERDLLALEKAHDSAARQKLFEALSRTMHTLKGAAGSIGAAPIVTVAHRLEEIFAAARGGKMPTDAAFFNWILPSLDAFADAGRRLQEGQSLDGAPIAAVGRRLASFDARSAPAEPTSGAAARERPSAAAPAQEPIAPPSSASSPAPETTSDAPAPKRDGETIRVSAAKLDELLKRSGELLTTRHRFDDRYDAALGLLDVASDLSKRWRRAGADISALLRVDADADDGDGSSERLRRELDRLVGSCGDLVLRLEKDAQVLTRELAADRRALHQASVPLDEDIRSLRMLPFAIACEGLQRLVRDLTTGNDKRAELTVLGGDIEVDRSILEAIKEALLHIVRNAIDHGIEPIAARRAAGKPETGQVVIQAALNGPRIAITVGDDGRGIDLDALRQKLREGGKAVPEDPAELIRTIMLPGFSTRTVASAVSGRGVGLDVVATRIAHLRGSVDIRSEPRHGTRIIMSVPLTLTTIRAVLVEAADQAFAIESIAVQRAIRIGPDSVKSIEGSDVVMIDGRPLPVASLADVLGLPAPASAPDQRPAVVVAAGDRAAVVTVDEAVTERELVVSGLGGRLRRVPCVAGASILSDGRIGLILDPAALVEATTKGLAKITWAGQAEIEGVPRRRLLVVDDSLTVRMLEKSILEAEGYTVVVASDGNEAWQILLGGGIDLVVSDVEMPRMDGFSLTESIRASNKFRALPVILVTGQESEADKLRGMAVGANAYLLKSAFDQKELLATIAQIL
jgi:two-component system chemotaxis sensor kinase CheA